MTTLQAIAWICIGLGILTAFAIAWDIRANPQPMSVMNVTWPITGLYFPVIGLAMYWLMGRVRAHADQNHGTGHRHGGEKPFWQSVLVSVTHCGGGCTLGDSIAAPLVSSFGLTIAGSVLLAHFAGEFVAAYLFGILFQFLPIMAMGERNPVRGLINAVKADTLSLMAFEVGMFGWIALSFLLLLPAEPGVGSALFWFMMQIAMVIGFATAYPANWVLVKAGIKHGM